MTTSSRLDELAEALTSALTTFGKQLSEGRDGAWYRVDRASNPASVLSVTFTLGLKQISDELVALSVLVRERSELLAVEMDLARGDGVVIADGPSVSADSVESLSVAGVTEGLNEFLQLVADDVVMEIDAASGVRNPPG